MVLLERKHPDPVYRVVEIVKKDAVSHPGSSLPRAAKALDINVNEIEYDRLDCPYCGGSDWAFIKCGSCGVLSCAGGVKEYGGKHLHVCPWCGTEAQIVEGTVEKVSGKMPDREQILPGEETENLLPPA